MHSPILILKGPYVNTCRTLPENPCQLAQGSLKNTPDTKRFGDAKTTPSPNKQKLQKHGFSLAAQDILAGRKHRVLDAALFSAFRVGFWDFGALGSR